jgi:hypothetical protein
MDKKKVRRKTTASANSSRILERQVFEAEVSALRLIAAPDPGDDISDDELTFLSQGSSFSSQLIRQIIDCIKAI